ncbi:MAG: Fe-S cluster assembly protein IscX [Acidobacteriia bacterium]|nr:Fe-S cluster assembly protein IscX [Terriglobia bacterium]
MLTELGNFNDDPKMSDDGTLEAIQIAWPTKFLGACNNFCRGINVCSHVFGSP